MLSKTIEIKTKSELKKSIDNLPNNSKIKVIEVTNKTDKEKAIKHIRNQKENISIIIIQD